MNNSKINFGVGTIVVSEFKRSLKRIHFIEENLYTPVEFLEFLYNVAIGDEKLDRNSEYEVGERIYEEGEGTPPSIFYGKITKFNDNWVFTLKE